MDLSQVIRAMATQTFETMCFLMVEEEPPEETGEEPIRSRLVMRAVDSHARYATAVLSFEAAGFAVEEALSMMGDEEMSREDMEEALGELANIVGGQILGEVDPGAVYDLIRVRSPEDDVEDCTPIGEATLAFDGGFASLTFSTAA